MKGAKMQCFDERLGFFAPDVFSIPYQELIEHYSLEAVFFDLDNTLFPYNGKAIAPEVVELIHWLTSLGVKVCLESNNPDPRSHLVSVFDTDKVYYHTTRGFADLAKGLGKPNPNFFLEACRKMDVNPSRSVAIGDCFTRDALAALGAGMLAITVDRDGKDPWFEWWLMTRHFESLYLRDHGVIRFDGFTAGYNEQLIRTW